MRRTKEITAVLLTLILVIGMGSMTRSFAAAPDNNAGAAENTGQSADNSLSSLSLSEGTLSPAFQYNVTDYTTEVGGDVSSVEVNAKLSNEKATIESIAGNTDLKEGKNTISIVVKAENGMTATYKIVVTRGASSQEDSTEDEKPKDTESEPNDEKTENTEGGQENPGEITIHGHPFQLSATVPEEVIPKDFTKTSMDCQGQQVEGLKFDKGELTLVYLTTPSTEVKNTLAVYQETGNIFHPFRRVSQGEDNYLILLDPPTESGWSEEYTIVTQTIGGFEDVPVYARTDAAPQGGNGAGGFQGAEDTSKGTTKEGFYLVYAVSSFGNMGWYQYDGAESTFQRFVTAQGSSQTEISGEKGEETSAEMQALQNAYKDLEEKYNQKKESSGKTTAVLIFIVAVLVVAVVNLILRGRRDEDLDESDEDDDEEEGRLGIWKRKHFGRGEAERREELESRRKSRMDNLYKEDAASVKGTHRKGDGQETESRRRSQPSRKKPEGEESQRRSSQSGQREGSESRRASQSGNQRTAQNSTRGKGQPERQREGVEAGRRSVSPGNQRTAEDTARRAAKPERQREGTEAGKRTTSSGMSRESKEFSRGVQPEFQREERETPRRNPQPGQQNRSRGEQNVDGRQVSQETKVMHQAESKESQGRHIPQAAQPVRNNIPRTPVNRDIEDEFEVIDLEDL